MAHNKSLEQVFSNGQVKLHEIVALMISTPDLDGYFKRHPEHSIQLNQVVLATTAAFEANQEWAKYSLHRSLGWLYELNLYSPDVKPVFNQYHPILMSVQQALESCWEHYELTRIRTVQYPDKPSEFADWFKKLVISHEVADHPLYTYLEHDASRDEIAYFFSQEVTVDSRFDDLVALAQIGLDNPIKLELAENYWDELGNGNIDMIHTVMFKNLLNELMVTHQHSLQQLFDAVEWQSLASGNLLLYMALYRRNAYKALGAMGVVEMISPLRFHRLVGGFNRIGLSEYAQQYHRLHIQIDARHGNGWLRHAIDPVVRANPALRDEILAGAFYRFNTSKDYCDRILAGMRGQRYVSAVWSNLRTH